MKRLRNISFSIMLLSWCLCFTAYQNLEKNQVFKVEPNIEIQNSASSILGSSRGDSKPKEYMMPEEKPAEENTPADGAIVPKPKDE